MAELKPCPFCGCQMIIKRRVYPNLSWRYAVDGWHDNGCPLQWLVIEPEDDDDNPLPPEEIAERWNRRWEDA